MNKLTDANKELITDIDYANCIPNAKYLINVLETFSSDSPELVSMSRVNYKYPNYHHFTFYLPPQNRLVILNLDHKQHIFNLPFPHMYFFVNINIYYQWDIDYISTEISDIAFTLKKMSYRNKIKYFPLRYIFAQWCWCTIHRLLY